MKKIKTSIYFVFSERRYKIIGISSFIFFLVLYLITLPSSYTGGRIGLISFKFLTVQMVIFAVVFALLLGILIPFIIFLFNRSRKGHSGAAAGGIFVSIITPFLCCSPLLPIVIGFIGGIIPILQGSFGLTIQAFVATHETEIYLGAVVLLLLSIYQNARSVVECPECKIKPQMGSL